MEKVGISLSGQHSRHIKEYTGKEHFGYLITLCGEAEASCSSAFPGIGQRLGWLFEDPSAFRGPEDEKLASFRK